MEAGGAIHRGHQTPERDRGEKSSGEQRERERERLLFLRECLTNTLLAKRTQWEKMGTLQFFKIFF